jgi:rRNA maturation protein Nop10
MIQPEKCEICGSQSFINIYMNMEDYLYGSDGIYSLWKCKECGVIITFPLPDFSRIYPNDYYSYKVEQEEFKYKLRKYIKNVFKIPNAIILKIVVLIEEFLYNRSVIIKKGGNLLDIGCGAGSFLKKVKERGMVVYGVDPFIRAYTKSYTSNKKDL